LFFFFIFFIDGSSRLTVGFDLLTFSLLLHIIISFAEWRINCRSLHVAPFPRGAISANYALSE
jgi:hypothetical protein